MHVSAVRPSSADDAGALRAIVEATGLFPPEMLDAMMAPGLAGEAPDLWFTADGADGDPVGFAYVVPEQMAEGTWNLLAIGVLPARQGEGHGARLMRHVEAALAARGERLLIVDTSGTPEFEAARAFYRGLGYDEEARIRDFWAAGDDKVVFRRALAVTAPA